MKLYTFTYQMESGRKLMVGKLTTPITEPVTITIPSRNMVLAIDGAMEIIDHDFLIKEGVRRTDLKLIKVERLTDWNKKK